MFIVFIVVVSPLQIPYFAFTKGDFAMLNSDRLVLDQNRQAMQKSSAFLTAVPHDFPGLLPRTVKAGDGTGMDQGFSGRNSLLHDINELQRRHGTCFQHGDDLMRLTRAEVLKWDDILLDLTTQMNKKTNRHQTNRHQQHLFTKSGKSSSNPQKRVTLAVTFKASSKCKLSMASSENWTLLIAQRYLDPKGYSATKQQSPASVPRVKEIVGMSRRLQCACHESERLEGIACWPSTCCKNFAFYESVHEYVQRWRPERLLCCR